MFTAICTFRGVKSQAGAQEADGEPDPADGRRRQQPFRADISCRIETGPFLLGNNLERERLAESLSIAMVCTFSAAVNLLVFR